MIKLPEIVDFNGKQYIYVRNLHWCGYWGTYSRVLQRPNKSISSYVEINVSPVNGWSAYDARDQIQGVKIRRHYTSRDKNDFDCNLLPVGTYNSLVDLVGIEEAHFILFAEDILPTIDWDKYSKVCNGGARLAMIQK